MNCFLRKTWPYLLAVIVFVAVGCIYMSPELDGKVIGANDTVQATSAVQESVKYREDTGTTTWWNGAMFSGMPNFQIGGYSYQADRWMRPFKKLFYQGHQSAIAIVILYCLAFYALLCSMKVNRWLAIVGALAIAFSSYFFIIIAARHNTKTSSLAMMTLVIAGFYLIYRKKYGIGMILTMLCTAAGLYPHPQMAYYLCLVIGFFFMAELWIHLKAKQIKQFLAKTAIFAFSFVVGAGTGTAATFANMEYASQTMRGGHSDLAKEKDASNRTAGLDLDYATAWSYGIDESLTFLVPDFMGGSSNYPVGKESELYKTMVKKGVDRRTSEQFCQSVPTYWGEQPFTAGPVYMGAIVCFLYVLGLFIVKGPYKWALLAVTLLSVFLSWGHHWMGLTHFFFDYFPMYNKFRAVSSILVIAEITVPLLGFLALKQLSDAKDKNAEPLSQEQAGTSTKCNLKLVYWAAGITGGLALFLALFGTSLFSFVSPNDERMFAQIPEWLGDAIIMQRESMFVSDAWRSLGFIVAAALLVIAFIKVRNMKTSVFALLLGVLVLADMWPVNKRYMNDDAFSKKKNFESAFKMQPYEKQILQDKDPHYRVFNLAVNTFNDARTSYYLKSIGGYHAAKLRRYQDIIDEHLSKMNWKVINMLNAKYIIVSDKSGAPVPQLNPNAMGNAWFVDSLLVVNTPNEESDALRHLDLSTTAVLDKQFASHVEGWALQHDSTAHVRLTQYAPGSLKYDAVASLPGTIVFSEIYYPDGWQATVDGKPVDLYRVNYVLQALNIEPGMHQIHLEFHPKSIDKGNLVSMIFVVTMYLTILIIIGRGIWTLWQRKKEGNMA